MMVAKKPIYPNDSQIFMVTQKKIANLFSALPHEKIQQIS